ncbi:glycosyltransferase family 4 protein [Desulfobacula toluolica]|uniref:RfaG: putative lipopolysaccharide cor biosynthesis protein n=1 Tax=Desulfobacula toluolica (strain DSM 7467 / Tol2) TaxID=651182 RepID=K0NL12_DESTT|nr:glycosyltransferase family 4 protein [Desulfobacula toluolica]CCK79417.1 RfaG: putative lipopolysaccharide cor biosynthesis protein [Desulfobacula toluolica Tol2]
MKIALLVKRFTLSGGKERYVVELARALQRRGHSIHVFACQYDNSLSKQITFHKVVSRFDSFSVLNTLSFIKETAKLLSKQKYDIIHSHERNYTQKILTLHSLSYCEGLEKYSFIRRIDQKYFSLRSLLYLWLEKRQMRSPWLISVSQEVSRDVKKYYDRSENIVTIPPGVDTDQFNSANIKKLRDQARKEKKVQKDELAVLFVGSAFQRKGLGRLLPEIKENMRLFVVGKGDKLVKYKRLIKAYGIEKKVILTGMVNDVKQYYALADVVVLPSRSEAFGMSALEGMACGLPVIVTQNCGVADLIENNKNGLVMKKNSDLAKYLHLLRSKEERLRLGTLAEKTAKAYSWERVGLTHEAFYKQILSCKLSA